MPSVFQYQGSSTPSGPTSDVGASGVPPVTVSTGSPSGPAVTIELWIIVPGTLRSGAVGPRNVSL
jgi:hypothetical protein